MEGTFSFQCTENKALTRPSLHSCVPGQDNLHLYCSSFSWGRGSRISKGCGFWGLLLQREHEQNGVCCSRAGAGEVVVWVYLAHSSHDTLGNKHSHFLSGQLLWINKQDCRAALVWKSRDKPPLLLGWLPLVLARRGMVGKG